MRTKLTKIAGGSVGREAAHTPRRRRETASLAAPAHCHPVPPEAARGNFRREHILPASTSLAMAVERGLSPRICEGDCAVLKRGDVFKAVPVLRQR